MEKSIFQDTDRMEIGFKNAIVNPQVKIQHNDTVFTGQAKLVEDEGLSKKISELKYPGEERAKEKRVTIEVTLD